MAGSTPSSATRTVLSVSACFWVSRFFWACCSDRCCNACCFSNGTQLVMMAARGTAAVFFAMAGIASTTKRDFSGLGNFLSIGAIVIMLAVVANLFFASPVFHLAIVAAFVLFSSLLILYQIN